MKRLFLFIYILSSSILANGQEEMTAELTPNDQERIRFIIDNFFYFLAEGDTTNMKLICSSDMVLRSTYSDENGMPTMVNEPLQDFLDAVGTERTDKWDERISDLEIKVDDNLGHAWMNYEFYFNDKFSHCGVNSFQFVRSGQPGQSWKIISIIDTRRKSNCNESKDD